MSNHTHGHLREATAADLTDADNRVLAEALEPACPRCGRLVLAGPCCPEPIPCSEDDSAPEYLPCRPGFACSECGEPAVLVDYAHAYACSEACLAAFWAAVQGGEE